MLEGPWHYSDEKDLPSLSLCSSLPLSGIAPVEKKSWSTKLSVHYLHWRRLDYGPATGGKERANAVTLNARLYL
jgi:hypothetical protein